MPTFNPILPHLKAALSTIKNTHGYLFVDHGLDHCLDVCVLVLNQVSININKDTHKLPRIICGKVLRQTIHTRHIITEFSKVIHHSLVLSQERKRQIISNIYDQDASRGIGHCVILIDCD